MPALIKILGEFSNINLILVPHEVHEVHLQSIEGFLLKNNLKYCRYTSLNNNFTSNIVIVDVIGILSKLYMHTNIAYIGGAFGKGVHNVMEPAAFYQPAIFGTKYINSHEACELVKMKAGFSISKTEEIYNLLKQLITDESFRAKCSETSGNFLINNLGATEKIYKQIEREL